MTTKAIVTSLMIVVGAFIGVQNPHKMTGENKDLTKVYETSIVKKIEKCEMRAELLYASNSVTLWNYADLQAKKAEFFDAQKDMLIHKMVQKQLEPKRYKIEHFLEAQFYRHIGK